MNRPGLPYRDLRDQISCDHCGRGGGLRLAGMAKGCRWCADVVTRHQCTGRPDIYEMNLGASWECPACGTAWTAREEEVACRKCERPGVRTWSFTPGGRLDTAPRYQPSAGEVDAAVKWDERCEPRR